MSPERREVTVYLIGCLDVTQARSMMKSAATIERISLLKAVRPTLSKVILHTQPAVQLTSMGSEAVLLFFEIISAKGDTDEAACADMRVALTSQPLCQLYEWVIPYLDEHAKRHLGL
jgi:ribonuclease PH